MIILPEREEILDFVCGDKDFWVVSGAQNLAYVKPAKAGAQTNLNLVTASGQRLLVPPDRRRRRARSEGLRRAGRRRRPRHAVASSGSIRRRRSTNSAAARRAGQRRRPRTPGSAAARAIEERDQRVSRVVSHASCSSRIASRRTTGRSTCPRSFTTGGSPTSGQRPRNCRRSTRSATATPNLVHFQVEHGIYVVPKVLERGYLAIGKQTVGLRRAAGR